MHENVKVSLRLQKLLNRYDGIIWTQHERYRTNDTARAVLTKYNYIENACKRENPITPTEIIESKWWDNMMNYTSWLITLQTWRNEWTDKSQNYMPPYYHMRDIKIQIYTNVKQKKY